MTHSLRKAQPQTSSRSVTTYTARSSPTLTVRQAPFQPLRHQNRSGENGGVQQKHQEYDRSEETVRPSWMIIRLRISKLTSSRSSNTLPTAEVMRICLARRSHYYSIGLKRGEAALYQFFFDDREQAFPISPYPDQESGILKDRSIENGFTHSPAAFLGLSRQRSVAFNSTPEVAD